MESNPRSNTRSNSREVTLSDALKQQVAVNGLGLETYKSLMKLIESLIRQMDVLQSFQGRLKDQVDLLKEQLEELEKELRHAKDSS